MKKFLLLFILFAFCSKITLAQTYGNEWINYDQKHYSFKIWRTGIYKIDYSTLINSNIPINQISSKNIQIFGKEKEIPLYIVDGGDDTLHNGDYILFYGERNDGWLDSTLYKNPNDIGNPGYSLFNDTINYFFTWNTSTNNLRFIEESATNYNSYTPCNYIITDLITYYASIYIEGYKEDYRSSSFYTPGEGWGTGNYGFGPNFNNPILNLNLNTSGVYIGNDAPSPRFVGISNRINSSTTFSGLGNHHTRWNIGNNDYTLLDEVKFGYGINYINTTFPISELTNGITPVKWSIINDQGASTDLQSLNYWSLSYPKIPDLNYSVFNKIKVPNSTISNKIRIDFSNIYPNSTLFVFGDVPKKINLQSNNGQYSTLLSNSTNGSTQEIIIHENNSIYSITNLTSVNSNGYFTNYSSFNYEKALLMIYHPSLDSSSLEYAAYRNSIQGGHHNVVLANIEELYLQFGGGIPKHINSIRRFSFYVYNQANEKPVALFMLAKGVVNDRFMLNFTASIARQNSSYYALNLIPPFGYPPSDQVITADLLNDSSTPLIPTGRISAQNNTQLINYLNKVKEYESEQDTVFCNNISELGWKKQVLHFSGGSDANQQTIFQSSLNTMENTIESANFAGEVSKYYKSSTNPFDINVLTDISDKIESGVSLMTFFGHNAPTTSGFEINLDSPENWSNQGKYPFMVSNSCFNGDVFTSQTSTSESFVNSLYSGAIGFLSPTNQGISNSLDDYSNRLYKELSTLSYRKPIGLQIKNTINYMDALSNSLTYKTASHQMTLNCDPLIKINAYPYPEIEIKQNDVTFSPSVIDLNTEFLTLNVVLNNFGKAVTDTFKLEVTRHFPNNLGDSTYTFLIPNLNFKDTLNLPIKLYPALSQGINNFDISVDIPNSIKEQFDEQFNNQINKTFYLNIDGIQPVLPYNYAVVPDENIVLKASTFNPIADINTYLFEIDTTDFFNSPEHRFHTVTGLGGVFEVKPNDWKNNVGQNFPLTMTDSTVFFWRVALQSPNPIWTEQSFQYIKGKTGWGQDHFFQFKNNTFDGIQYKHDEREKVYFPKLSELTCNNRSTTPTISINYEIDGIQQEFAICYPTPSIHVAVIDPATMKPWETYNCPSTTSGCGCTPINSNHQFGNANNGCGSCRTRVERYFVFKQNDLNQLTSLIDMVTNSVPDSHYLLIYAPLTADYNSINTLQPNFFTLMQSLGSTSINASHLPNEAFSFFCKKGAPSSAIEGFANGAVTFQIKGIMSGFDDEGMETSPFIGPSANWGNLYWKQHPKISNDIGDSTRLRIKFYNLDYALQQEIDTLFSLNDSLLNLNQIYNANQYPYIKLQSYYYDKLSPHTPAVLDRWHILYEPLPEAAIDGKNFVWQPKDTLDEGEKIKFAVDVKNIDNYDMDSLLVNYWIEDNNHFKIPIQYPRQDSLRIGETLKDTIEINTLGLSKGNILWMEVNPYLSGSYNITDQPEQKHFNNILQYPFYVINEEKNPILDVTFDKKHIINGDIISPKSNIEISLNDENQYLIMDSDDDTSRFTVYLTDPNGIQKRIYFKDSKGNDIMTWTPASSQNKSFKINYPLNIEKDGKYTLMVQGSDRSGNLSGEMDYKIAFEVIQASTITYLMNYPNPFSTSTKFVFTLTGTETPDKILIQIMNVSGKVVKEITQDELGPIYIGRNITEYAWDGTDNFGDKLANGVYLYTVKALINGQEIDKRTTEGDKYFKKEFGKIYIFR